jgi:hypothetical protein
MRSLSQQKAAESMIHEMESAGEPQEVLKQQA